MWAETERMTEKKNPLLKNNKYQTKTDTLKGRSSLSHGHMRASRMLRRKTKEVISSGPAGDGGGVVVVFIDVLDC